MRNFILSPNFKNSVKASFLSLVILAASLSFGCCLNASATHIDNKKAFSIPFPSSSSSDDLCDDPENNNNEPANIVNLSNDIDEGETAGDVTFYHPPCECHSTNIYEDEFPAFGVNSPEMNMFDLYCSQKMSLDDATENFKSLYNDNSPRFEANCKDILYENGVNMVKRNFNLQTKLATAGKRNFPPGTAKEGEIRQNFLNKMYEL